MDRLSLISAAVLLVECGTAHAFVSPSPPAGFAGTAGAWTWTPPTAAQQIGGIMRGPGPSIAGQASSAAFRLAPGAARALAGAAARSLIPGLGLALGVAWLAQNCFEKRNGSWVRTCGPGLPGPIVDGFEYQAVYQPNGGGIALWYPTAQAACEAVAGAFSAQYNVPMTNIRAGTPGTGDATACLGTTGGNPAYPFTQWSKRVANCPVGWYSTSAGCIQYPPLPTVTEQQIEDDMAAKPLPQQLPPGFPYPLDPLAPTIWEPDTANPPNSQPKRVPQGNPRPVPNTNPQQYSQPVTRWTHSPTADDPWRMDVRPEDIVGTSPTGITSPQSVTSGSPAGKEPDKFDLCKEHPDIIACQVFKPDELEPKPVPNENKNLTITPDSGWGASNASCPADKTASLSFGPIAFSYEPLCLFANGIRPMVIALAWFSAALTFFGFARKDS